MHDEQRSTQGPDSLAQVGLSNILDEVPLERERLTTGEERGFAILLDSLNQGVVVALDVRGFEGSADAGHRRHPRAVMGRRDDGRAAEGMPDQVGTLRADRIAHLEHRLGMALGAERARQRISP